MSKRKGEITPGTIDRFWPFQVAIHSELCIDDQFAPLDRLARELGGAPRWRRVLKREETGFTATYNLMCFTRREDAQCFIDQAGGRHFDPVKDRVKPKHINVWTWDKWGEPRERHAEIVARLERVRSREPDLEADIAMLLGLRYRIGFTHCLPDVEAFLCGYLPEGEFEYRAGPDIDARVRHGADQPWRSAGEGKTRARDCVATALTLAFLRGWTP